MSKSEKCVLELIRCFLFGNPVNEKFFRNLSVQDWSSIKNFASLQGVAAITFNGIQKSAIRPPKSILIYWLGQAEYIKKSYLRHYNACKNLCGLYSKYGINIMVMKGLSLTPYYPSPECREFGDMDIYTYSKHEEANKVFIDMGVSIEYDDKHDMFTFGSVYVEHHKMFINNNSKQARLLNKYLEKEGAIQNCSIHELGFLKPNANFNAVFLLRHMIEHFAYEGLTIKNILDWGLFLIKDGSFIDRVKVAEILIRSKHMKAFNVFVAVAEHFLNIKLSAHYFELPDKKIVNRVVAEIMETKLHVESDSPFFKRIIGKTKRKLSHKWMFDCGLIPDNFWISAVMWSLISHIKHTNQI